MPVLGADFLIPTGSSASATKQHELLFCEIKGLKATGYLGLNGFAVLKGSQAVAKERASAHQHPYVLALRQKLQEDGILVEEDNFMRFARDAEFTSPSAPAAVIHGGTANGLLAWKNKSGKTLKEHESV